MCPRCMQVCYVGVHVALPKNSSWLAGSVCYELLVVVGCLLSKGDHRFGSRVVFSWMLVLLSDLFTLLNLWDNNREPSQIHT